MSGPETFLTVGQAVGLAVLVGALLFFVVWARDGRK